MADYTPPKINHTRRETSISNGSYVHPTARFSSKISSTEDIAPEDAKNYKLLLQRLLEDFRFETPETDTGICGPELYGDSEIYPAVDPTEMPNFNKALIDLWLETHESRFEER